MSANRDRLIAMGLPFARCDQSYPAGTIVTLSADLARYPQFEMSMHGLKYPYGTRMDRRIGCDVVGNLNMAIREMEGDWLFIMGDDHIFDTNLLIRLLSRLYDDGHDLVAPLVHARQAPFPTVIGVRHEAARRIDSMPASAVSGLQPVDMVGSAGLLVRRAVLDKVGDPWFESGKVRRGALGEDWWFCIRAQDAGYQCYVDASIEMGHIISAVVWPNKQGTPDAGVRVDLGPGYQLEVRHEVSA